MEEQEASLLEEFVAAAERSNGGAPQDTAENGAAETADGNATGEAETAPETSEAQTGDPNPEEDPSASSEESNTANEDASAPKSNKYSHRKFKRTEYENRELKRQLAEVQAYIRAQQEKESQAKAEAEKPKKPVRSQFSSDDEFQDALAFWHASNVRAQQDEYSQQQAQAAQERNAWVQEYADKLHRVYEGDPQGLEEWKELHSANPPMPMVLGRQLSEYIYSLDDGPKVQAYLWKHPKATQKLVSSHPFMQAEMLRNIRDFVGRKPETAKNNPATNSAVSQPEPFGSVRTGAAKADSVNLDNASAGQIFDMILAAR